MNLRLLAARGVLSLAMSAGVVASAHAQGTETFTATATVKTAAAAMANAPVTIVLSRKMSQQETDSVTAAFTNGGAAGLRKALDGVPATGSVQLGGGTATPTRVTLERTTDKGRLLTMVTDQPILFLGAGLPGASPKEGYDFAVIDIEVDAEGSGTGTLSPAAKITLKEGAFTVDDYASELVRLTDVKRVKQ